jgi:hypothetical protein
MANVNPSEPAATLRTDLARWAAWLTGMTPESPLSPSEVWALVSAHCDIDFLRKVSIRLQRFLQGTGELSPLELYSALEQCTPLILFHLLPRRGKRNRYHSGIQQSYGDHNRLLLLGIEKLQTGDLNWFKTRNEGGDTIDENALGGVLKLDVVSFSDKTAQVALWVAASLHDFGKLGGTEFGLDAEDAVFLAKPILDELVPTENRELVEFVIRNHDLIEYTRTGETPRAFIARQLQALPAQDRARALVFLGIVQLAGAASLGEGRLNARKLSICEECTTGVIISDTTIETRLAMLLRGESAEEHGANASRVHDFLRNRPAAQQGRLRRFLDMTVLRGWVQASAAIDRKISTATEGDLFRLDLLTTLSEVSEEVENPHFLVLTERGAEELLNNCGSMTRAEVSQVAANAKRLVLLSGSTAAVI